MSTTVAVALALFGAVSVVRFVGGGPADAVAMLYALPIALLAVAFGLRGGVASGLLGVALVATWVLLDEVDLSVIGWASRVLPLLLLGVLLGHATDMLRDLEAERRALEAAALRHREAIEINDSLIQGMAAAKWSLEAGKVQGGLATLDHTIALGQRLVSELLRDAAAVGGDERPSARPKDSFR